MNFRHKVKNIYISSPEYLRKQNKKVSAKDFIIPFQNNRATRERYVQPNCVRLTGRHLKPWKDPEDAII